MKQFNFLLANLLVSVGQAQNILPVKDTVIENNGVQIEYKVYEHAIFMTTYKDGKWNGPFKSFYKNGKIWSENNRINGQIEGKSISYTPNGKVAIIEEWKNGILRKRKIFYQNTIAEPQKYFFVSKEGFNLIKDGRQIPLDNTTPDSLVEENSNGVYIWYKGERKLFSGTESPKYKLIKTGNLPGLYRIENTGKETFIRPLTRKEKE